jgi:thiol peroxidase
MFLPFWERGINPFTDERKPNMEERTGIITVLGNPLTLVGPSLEPGDAAPDATLLDNDLNPVKLSSFRGKTCIISVVTSLDTPVCDVETRRFNQEAATAGDDTVILTVSMDLPFAQKRWCGNAGIDRVITLSDHSSAEFGTAYGVLIKELRLLARTIFIVDKEGVIKYVQRVKENSEEPDYDAVLKALSGIN